MIPVSIVEQAFNSLLNNKNHPNKNNLEKLISTNAEFSYHYANDVLDDRFFLGENAISQDSFFAYNYAKHIVHGKLPESMHNAMIAHAITDPENYSIKQYFNYIQHTEWQIQKSEH